MHARGRHLPLASTAVGEPALSLAASLLNLNLGVPRLNLASANVDIGFASDYRYGGKLSTSPPPFLPAPAATIWDPQTFAEVPVP